jgi:hypothetical protein
MRGRVFAVDMDAKAIVDGRAPDTEFTVNPPNVLAAIPASEVALKPFGIVMPPSARTVAGVAGEPWLTAPRRIVWPIDTAVLMVFSCAVADVPLIVPPSTRSVAEPSALRR